MRMFFHYGLYARHLQTYIDEFGRDALLVESSEDFFSEASHATTRTHRLDEWQMLIMCSSLSVYRRGPR